jgi:Uma2 family endonuclease
MAVAEPVRKLTEAEYLEIERAAEFKSEFFEGEVFAMSGGTARHSLIATNLAREFGNQLRGKPCTAYNSDLRIKVEASGLITYPDLSIICGPLNFVDEGGDTVVNPTVIVEVLSPSTEAYDRGRKFENYRLIPGFKEYLLIGQGNPHVEQFIRGESGEWVLREAGGLDGKLDLAALNMSLPLSEVYWDVDFGSVA